MALKLDGKPVGPDWRKVKSFFRKTKFLPFRQALLQAGVFLEGRVKTGIITGKPGGKRLKPNVDSTKVKKGSSKPLIDTGTMLRSITTKKISRKEVFVGILATVTHPGGHGNEAGKSMALIGRFHEFITDLWPTLPRREFLNPVVLKEKDRLVKEFALKFGDELGLGVSGADLL